MNSNDGGPAFPIPARTEDDGVMQISHQGAPGMSIRDVFAGQAMAGVLASYSGSDVRLPPDDVVAAYAWDYAEAMMAERERRYGKPEQTPETEAEVEGAAF